MDRSEFLTMFASAIPAGAMLVADEKEPEKERLISKPYADPDEDELAKMYDMIVNNEPVEIGGIKFYFAGFQNHIGEMRTASGNSIATSRTITLELETTLPA